MCMYVYICAFYIQLIFKDYGCNHNHNKNNSNMQDSYLQDLKSNIINDIDSGVLRNNILNCKTVNDLSNYLNIIVNLDQSLRENKVNFDSLLEKIDKIITIEPLAEILNLNYWLKPNLDQSDIHNTKKQIREELTSEDFILKLLGTGSVRGLASYFNLNSEDVFADFVKETKDNIIKEIDSGNLRNSISKPEYCIEKLNRVFEIGNWSSQNSKAVDVEMTDHQEPRKVGHDAMEPSGEIGKGGDETEKEKKMKRKVTNKKRKSNNNDKKEKSKNKKKTDQENERKRKRQKTMNKEENDNDEENNNNENNNNNNNDKDNDRDNDNNNNNNNNNSNNNDNNNNDNNSNDNNNNNNSNSNNNGEMFSTNVKILREKFKDSTSF